MRSNKKAVFTRLSPEPNELAKFLKDKAAAEGIIAQFKQQHEAADLWQGESYIVTKLPVGVAEVFIKIIAQRLQLEASIVRSDGGIPGLVYAGRDSAPHAVEVRIRNPKFRID